MIMCAWHELKVKEWQYVAYFGSFGLLNDSNALSTVEQFFNEILWLLRSLLGA